MKWNKILLFMLAVAFVLALAGCADKERAGEEDFQFMQAESDMIRQADIDYMKRCVAVGGETAFEDVDVLTSLAVMRAVVWEAEELGLAESWAEAREIMAERYQKLQAAAEDESNSEHDMAVWIIEYEQKMKQEVPMTDDEYLNYNAFNHQVSEAYDQLKERFEADLPPEVREDVWLKIEAWQGYVKSLLEKYHDELVEPDLLPLLDEILKNM